MQLAAGLVLLALAYVVGIRTGSFHAHIMFPLGFWLTFDAIDYAKRRTSLLRSHGARAVAALFLGAMAGVFLDFLMVVVTSILDLHAVNSVLTALEMYLGWGLCLPAIYASYQVMLNLGVRVNRHPIEGNEKHLTRPAWHRWGHALLSKEDAKPLWLPLTVLGSLLFCIPLFVRMYGDRPVGWLIVFSFAGLWLVMEGIMLSQGRHGLLALWLEGRWWPTLAILPPALLFVLAWEGLNGFMRSWEYRNLFWLEPKVLGVPLVAVFGYVSWYVLFLSLYELAFGGAFNPGYRLRGSRRPAKHSEE